MSTRKVAVTIDSALLADLDRWVAEGEFPNRSQAMQAAVRHLKDERQLRTRLLSELAKLDPHEERALADEVLVGEDSWLEF